MPPHVVIIGGGFAGLNAARKLETPDVRVTLVDRHNYHLFQPLLYQVALAVLSPADIASPIRAILSSQRNVRVLLAEAQAIDPVRRVVALDRGSLTYDYLVLASGASHAYFGHEEWRELAPGLKSLDDALEIRRRVLLSFERAEREADPSERRRLLTFVVVGGGPTGVELAGAISGIAREALVADFRAIDPSTARVVLLEGGPHILPTFPESLRVAARHSLEALQVEVRTRAMVTNIEAGCTFVGQERIEAGTILWAAGVAASGLGRSLGVEVDRVGRVPVDECLRVPAYPEVFVLGDLAIARDRRGEPLPGLAAVALQQGQQTGRNILRAIRGERLVPFRYRNYGNMAVIGRAFAVADFGWLRLTGWIAWWSWLGIHLVKLIGFRNRLVVLFNWASAYLASVQGVRLITNDTRTWRDDVPLVARPDLPGREEPRALADRKEAGITPGKDEPRNVVR